jgi:hypothetical protein
MKALIGSYHCSCAGVLTWEYEMGQGIIFFKRLAIHQSKFLNSFPDGKTSGLKYRPSLITGGIRFVDIRSATDMSKKLKKGVE